MNKINFFKWDLVLERSNGRELFVHSYDLETKNIICIAFSNKGFNPVELKDDENLQLIGRGGIEKLFQSHPEYFNRPAESKERAMAFLSDLYRIYSNERENYKKRNDIVNLLIKLKH